MIRSKTTKMMCVPFTIVCNRFTNAGNAHLRCRDKHSHNSHVSSVWVWHHYDHMMIHRVFLLLHPSATLLLVKASQTAPDGLWWLDQTAVKTDTGRNQLALIQVSVPGLEKKTSDWLLSGVWLWEGPAVMVSGFGSPQCSQGLKKLSL